LRNRHRNEMPFHYYSFLSRGKISVFGNAISQLTYGKRLFEKRKGVRNLFEKKRLLTRMPFG
jgi:hypothetical protein